nr:PREDICTED: uncharacterized protein K02A2.6-like [Linepithema humile]
MPKSNYSAKTDDEPVEELVVPPALSIIERAKLLNQMRKWGLHFDGKDPFSFLERVEELGQEYGFTNKQLLLGLPKALKGNALLWFRNHRASWNTWNDFRQDFKAFYLPPGYPRQLRREIQGRQQQPSEPFDAFAIALQTLMRRAGGYSEQEKLEQIYENMNPDLQLYIPLENIHTLSELHAKVANLEKIQQRQKERRPRFPERNNRNPVATATYNKDECCWRCKQRGHTRWNCKHTPKKFCSQCGKDGIEGKTVWALLDSGSEASHLNSETAQLIKRKPTTTNEIIHLADGSEVTINQTVQLSLTIPGKTVRHEFAVLPSLSTPILIGTDLWTKLQINLPPPPAQPQDKHSSIGFVTAAPVPDTVKEPYRLKEFLSKELPKFERIKGPTDLIEHMIRLKPGPPIKQRYRPQNPAMQKIIDDEVQKMENEGVIEASTSAWSSPVVIVRKKDGTHRFCIDYRKLNDVSEKDAYPLPHITATLEKLRGARYLSTLDLKNGYWQVSLSKESRPVTAFTIPGRGLKQFRVMPFGLHSAPATFQRLLDTVIGPELEPHVLVYLDDIVVASRTFEEHLGHLAEVFRRLRKAKLRLNPEKCQFCRESLRYLGHIVDKEGIRTDPEKALTIAPVLACPDFAKPFVLQTDASTQGLGAVLTQNHEKGEQVIAYASRTLNPAEKNYSATELECLAVVWGIRKMRDYLEGEPIINAVSRTTTCRWYNRIKAAVKNKPEELPDYKIINGQLFRHKIHDLNFHETPSTEQWKKCVPKNQRLSVLKRLHDDPTAGHLGITKTIARIAQIYYWPGMFREIAKYVRCCENCLAFKITQEKPAGNLHTAPVIAPWQQASVDLIGPLPRSKQGHTWLLTILDRFSKWIEMVPLRRATATNLARKVTTFNTV